MKKLLTFLTLLTLSIGVTWAAEATDSWTAANGNLGSSNSGKTGTITTTGGKTWNYSRNITIYAAWNNNAQAIQLGSGSGAEDVTFTTSAYGTATIKSVSVECASYQGAHNLSISVGGNSYYAGATPTWSNNTLGTKTGTGNSSGEIKIEFTDGSRALYIKSISVTYEDGGSTPTTYTVTCNDNVANGSISASPTSAAEGTTVTLTAEPNPGYQLGSWNVKDESNNSITVTNNQFTMPASNVTVDATFTALPTYDVTVIGGTASPTSAYQGQTVTLTPTIPSNKVIDWNNTTVSPSSVEIDHSDYTFTMPGQNVTVTFAFKDDPSANAIFYESFNDYEFQGGNDENFSQGSGTFSNESNDLDWTNTSTVYGANHCIRMGSSGNNGSITSPAVGQIADETALHFRLAGWSSGTNTLTVTIDGGGTFSDGTTSKSYTATNSSWADITAELINLTANTTITFSGKRFFLDEIILEKPVEKAHTITSTASPSAGGFVTCKSSADSGEAISFTITTNSNYEFAYVEVKDANDNYVEFTEENGTYSFTMPESDVTITAHFNQAGTLYILGEANGKFDNADWQPNEGTLMTYSNGKYTARVYFKGYTKYNDGDGYSEFAFSKKLATKTAANGGWDEINWDGSRYGSGAEGSYWGIGGEGQSAFGSTIPLYNHSQKSYRVPAGVYDIEVDLQANPNTVKVTPVNLTVTLDPASGTFNKGKEIAISSNLTSIVASTGSNETVAIQHKIGDGEYENGNSVVLHDAGENITVTGMASLGHIKVEGTGTYTIENKYTVTIDDGISNGQVSVSSNNVAPGTEVTITATPSTGYSLGSITVTDASNNPITVTDGKFIMPESNVVVSATFTINSYSITTVPTNCSVDVASTANYNSQVTFTVTPRSDKYEVSTVTVTYGDGRTKPVTDNGDGTYSFYMPDDNVTLTVICTRKSTGGNQFTLVKSQTDIVAGGEYVILNAATTQAMTKTSSNNYDAYSTQYDLDGEIVTLTEGSDVSILKFIDGSTTGTFKIQDGNLYLTAASKKLNATANGSDWTVTLGSSNNVTIQSDKWVIKNNSNYFRCYDTNTGTLVKLYKRLPAGVSVEIDPATGNVIGSQVINVGSDTDGALVQYKVEKQNGSNWDVVTDWTEWTTYTEANGPVEFTITGNVGDVYQVTARAKEADQEVEPDEEEDFDEQTVQYTFVAPAAPTITPASCSVVDVKQNVTITSEYTNGIIEYSTDGGDTWNTYNGAFDVILSELGTSATVTARVTVNGVQSETVSATYTRNVQPVVFSPVSGTYYYGEQSVEMFSISQGARIYYSMTDDGSEPADPLMNDGGTLYTGPIEGLEAGKTYKFKAYAYIGTIKSEISTATYTIEAAQGSGYWPNIAAMNNEEYTTRNWKLENPVQIVYMSTYENNDTKPEFAYIRDNSGYGLVYFGNSSITNYNSWKKFNMGDWLAGGTVGGYTSVWYDGFHNELGSSSNDVKNWPSESVGNTAIIPETVTNAQVKAGWDDSAYDESDYSSGVTSSNLWGHYIHLRNNTLANVADRTSSDRKHKGVMTDQTNTTLTYYDVFYKFSGHNGAPHYDQSFFDARQNKGATFDFYGIVAFYGPDIDNEDYANQPFQIVPLDILWVYKPVISGVNSTDLYTTSKTVSLDLDPVQGDDESNSVIWYKTSEMEDFAIYTGPFEVSTSTKIETYTTKMTSYNDRMESVHVTMDVHFTVINPPVIAPGSQVKAVGSESVNSTITRDGSDGLSNVTIFFTIDGSDPSDPSSERYVYNTQNQASMLSDIRTTTTVRAVAAVGNDQDGYAYSAEAESRTYTFVKSNGIVYDLVNNISQLNSNGVYVIVSRKYSEALSNVQNTSNRGAAGVLFVDDTQAQVYGNDDVAVFTLTPLTDATDTGNEKHFLFHTSNGKTNAATGYLHVGANDDNTLLTEAEEDAMGNDVAVITIDADGRARIHFNYSGQDNRYLQYWNRDRLFNTYKSEYDDRAVYIYYKNATPLATIEKEGVPNGQYTIADQLLVVYAHVGEGKLWCKDQGNVSIAKTEQKDGQIDYMMEITKEQVEPWDQSNWVVLQFDNPALGSELETLLTNAPGKYIKPATISGTYSNTNNYTITMADQTLQLEDYGENYVKNLYCTANFLPKNLNINDGQGAEGIYHGETAYYFFMNPKVQEVCEITYAQWGDNNTFIVPLPTADNPTQNDSQIDGAFTVDWRYNVLGPNQVPSLSEDAAYKFWAVVQRSENSGYLKANKPGREPSGDFIVYPLNLDPNNQDYNNIVTAINTVGVTGKAVKSVKYVNVAGMVSDVPFQGVNIVVTEYTDGSRTTSKMLRK